MKKGIFIEGKIKGYNQLDFVGNRDIKGEKFRAVNKLKVSVWNAVYEFEDDKVTITPHKQLKKLSPPGVDTL